MARLPLRSRPPVVALTIALLAAGCGEGPLEPAEDDLVPVVRVVDGDTIWVAPEQRVRLIGIDTPEVDWYGGRAECYGEEAGLFMQGLLEGERVRLEYDQEPRDRYGRTLAYVYLEDGRMVNLLLVRRGYATVSIFEPNDRHEAGLRAAEREARGVGSGLWSIC
ncbi:MAG TPA: thermonuclease family protein [Actinomycetota bacterium]